jgi:hypothetical protein
MTRLGILISGRGSNFEAIADNIAAGELDAEIAVVISNRSDAPGLEAARRRGLPAVSIPSKGLDREVYDRMVVEELRRRGVEMVCLAGFMRLLSATFIRAFPNRILNIHPSLLPAFPGLDAQHQALGRRLHGTFRGRVPGCRSDPDSSARAGEGHRHGRDAFRAHSERGAPDLLRSVAHRHRRQLPDRRTAGDSRLRGGLKLSSAPVSSSL